MAANVITGRAGSMTLVSGASALILHTVRWVLTEEVDVHDTTTDADSYWKDHAAGMHGWRVSITARHDSTATTDMAGQTGTFTGTAASGMTYSGTVLIERIGVDMDKMGHIEVTMDCVGKLALTKSPTTSPSPE